MTQAAKPPLQRRLREVIQHLDVTIQELDPMVDKAPFQNISNELRQVHTDLQVEVMKLLDAAEKL